VARLRVFDAAGAPVTAEIPVDLETATPGCAMIRSQNGEGSAMVRRVLALGLFAAAIAVVTGLAGPAKTATVRFSVRYETATDKGPIDGRLLIMLSKDPKEEPRLQIRGDLRSQQVFGMDVEGWMPGQSAVLPDDALGFPLESLAEVPAGTHRVQALLHRYETFRRADGTS
jgi:hypothetical protein